MNKSFRFVIIIATVFAVAMGLCSVALASPALSPLPVSADHSKAYIMANGQRVSDSAYMVANNENTFIVRIGTGSNNVYVISASSGSSGYLAVESLSNVASYLCSTSVPDYGLYRTSSGTSYGGDYIATYSSLEAAYEAIKLYVNPPPASSALDIVVPNGYALYVSIPAETVTVQLSATMPYNSELFGTPWPTVVSYINNVISLPSAGDTVLVGSGWSAVPWEKSPTASTNLFGQTRYAVYSAYPSSGGWYVVYNPAVSWDSNLAEVSNPSILAHFSMAVEYRLYPTTDGVISGVQSMTLGEPWESSSEDDWSVTPPSGQDVIPPSGGNNALPDDTGVEGILNRLTEMIRSIFEVAWRPIQNITQSVSGFFEHLAELWTWLPSDVSALLIAGLTVIVSVGVLKSFL